MFGNSELTQIHTFFIQFSICLCSPTKSKRDRERGRENNINFSVELSVILITSLTRWKLILSRSAKTKNLNTKLMCKHNDMTSIQQDRIHKCLININSICCFFPYKYRWLLSESKKTAHTKQQTVSQLCGHAHAHAHTQTEDTHSAKFVMWLNFPKCHQLNELARSRIEIWRHPPTTH